MLAELWTQLRKECIWVYLAEFIESGSDGPFDSRRVSKEKKKTQKKNVAGVTIIAGLSDFSYLLASSRADYISGEDEVSAVYGDFYIFPNRRLNQQSLRVCTYVQEEKAGDSLVGVSHCTIGRLWGSSRRCWDSLEGVNHS